MKLPKRRGKPAQSDVQMFFSPEEILYAFVASKTTAGMESLVDAAWLRKGDYVLVPGRVYVRTRTGLFETYEKRLKPLHAKLGIDFERCHRSALANIRAVKWQELGVAKPRIGFWDRSAANGGDERLEAVAVAKDRVWEMRGWLGLPRRKRRPPGGSGGPQGLGGAPVPPPPTGADGAEDGDSGDDGADR